MPMDPTATKGVKLRNSCDSCNLAKVRCSKARPLCARCESHNVQCVYSVSLRSSSFRTNRNAASTEASTAESKALPEPPAPPPEGPNPFFAPSLLSIMESMPTDEEWASNLMEEDSLSNLASLTPADSMPFESQYPSPFNEDSSGVDQMMSSDHSTATTDMIHRCVRPHALTRSSTDSTASPPLDEYSTTSSADQQRQSATPNAPCGCSQLVLRKLFGCSINPSLPLSWDHALNQIKETTSLCAAVIHCHVCHSPDASHVLTIAALIAKIIALAYATCDPDHYAHLDSPSQQFNPLADIDSAFDFNLLEGGDHHRAWSLGTINYNVCTKPTTAAPSIAPAALMLPTPPTGQLRWALGAYNLDSKDEKKVRLEICKIELSKVRALFQEFKKRFCVAPSHDEHPTPESKAYHDLATYLERKLLDAVQRLRACH